MVKSRQHPLIQLYRSLWDAKGRQQHRLYLLEGAHLVEEAIRRRLPLHSVLWAEAPPPGLPATVRSECLDAALLSYVASTETPQSVVAALPLPAPPVVQSDGLYLVLDAVSDPGNVGTLVRTAAAAGVAGVVLHGPCADPWNPKGVRASAGAMLWFPVLPWDDSLLQGRILVATSSHQGVDYDSDTLSWRGPLLLALGSEAHGISPALSSHVAQWVRIPLAPGIESLNVAVAGGVLLFHARRR